VPQAATAAAATLYVTESKTELKGSL